MNEDEAPGIKQEGGTLNVTAFTIELEVAPDQIPEAVEGDLTGRAIGDVITVADLKIPAGTTPASRPIRSPTSSRRPCSAPRSRPRRPRSPRPQSAEAAEEKAEARPRPRRRGRVGREVRGFGQGVIRSGRFFRARPIEKNARPPGRGIFMWKGAGITCGSSSAWGIPARATRETRHNIGFLAVDEIARVHRAAPFRRRFQGEAAEVVLGSERAILLKPQTFMNESGRSVGEAQRFFKIALADVIVLHDELDLAPAKLRVKLGGGNAGHNGLRSITAQCGQRLSPGPLWHRASGDKALVHA